MEVGIGDEAKEVSVGQVEWGLRAAEWTWAFDLVKGQPLQSRTGVLTMSLCCVEH